MKLRTFTIIACLLCYVFTNAQCNDDIKSGEATFYGGVAGSEGGNCSLPVASDDFMHCALNNEDYDKSNGCGACLEVTGSRGKTIVKVVDRCPECKPGDVDLTQEAFSEVANPIDGRVPITWKFVPCPLMENETIKVNFKSGSSKYWTAIQFRDHKYAVSKMEYLKDDTWIDVERKLFNFFIEPKGIESPMQLRITSALGEELILKDIEINVNADFDTKLQFSTPSNCEEEPKQEPTASFTATPEVGTSPLEVFFDGSASSDPNGDAITYSWDFGNGETSTLATPKVTFTDIKTYTVTLTVSDGTNTSAPVTKNIVVSDGNIAPVANFTATPESGNAPVTVNFDASTSSDENGDTLTYGWDFGDGIIGTGLTVTHEYATVGAYTVKLTVSDGNKSGTKTTIINVTDGSPVASFIASAESGVAPFEVTFDGSASSDPRGGTLTYSWDLGNGETVTTPIASTTYTTAGQFTITLTVTNTDGDTDTEIKTVNVTDGSDGNTSCTFGTPRDEALPDISLEFKNIFVLGKSGPNFDNVTNFTINWNLANNGLYQFSMGTNNGTPNWYVNLLPKITHNFNASEPSITIMDSGFSGFNGAYWVTLDAGNLVLVSKTGDFTIYFSKDTIVQNCKDLPLLATTLSVETFNNPVKDKLIIRGRDILDGTRLTLINMSGRVIKTIQVQSDLKEAELYTANLSSGMYFVKINYKKREKTLKIIKD